MVAPLRGPFSRLITEEGVTGPGSYSIYGERLWWCQKKPLKDELPFTLGYTRILFQTVMDLANGRYGDAHNHLTPVVTDNFKKRAYTKAYSKFVSKVKAETAELGSTLAQYEKARSMIIDRAKRLREGFRAVRRGNLYALKSQWGKGAGIRANAKKQGSNVLEGSFGWAPLVKDIANAVKILGDGIPPPRVRSRSRFGYSKDEGYTNYGSTSSWNPTVGYLEISLRASIRVTNPNALLLQQLGLANPASVLWEIVPWSFIVDYFVNVQDFLDSWTDFLGLELERSSHTFFTFEDGRIAYQVNSSGHVYWAYSYKRVDANRVPGIPGPQLVLRLPWRMSVQRATTSIALLLQQLPSKRA